LFLSNLKIKIKSGIIVTSSDSRINLKPITGKFLTPESSVGFGLQKAQTKFFPEVGAHASLKFLIHWDSTNSLITDDCHITVTTSYFTFFSFFRLIYFT